MKIAFYCPNKALSHPHPSGDLVIALGIRKSLESQGHLCLEVVPFRSRWFWSRLRGWWEALSALIAAHGACQTFRPDIWLTYHTYYKSPDIIGPCLSRILRIPYVIFQPMYATRRRKNTRTKWGFLLNRWAIRSANHLFINNIHDLEAMERIADSWRITYLPPGIFPEDFKRYETLGLKVRNCLGIPLDIPLVMTACRFRPGVKVESLAYLFKSLGMVKESSERFTLLVVGDGPAGEEVRAMAKHRIGGGCVFAGGVPREEMARYYSAADVFAFPGIGESLGMVYLEAQACGLPVVALDTAGVPQVVRDGETGLLAAKDGGEAMALAVRRLLQDSRLRSRMGLRGMDYVLRERNLHKNYGKLSESLEAIRGDHLKTL